MGEGILSYSQVAKCVSEKHTVEKDFNFYFTDGMTVLVWGQVLLPADNDDDSNVIVTCTEPVAGFGGGLASSTGFFCDLSKMLNYVHFSFLIIKTSIR